MPLLWTNIRIPRIKFTDAVKSLFRNLNWIQHRVLINLKITGKPHLICQCAQQLNTEFVATSKHTKQPIVKVHRMRKPEAKNRGEEGMFCELTVEEEVLNQFRGRLAEVTPNIQPYPLFDEILLCWQNILGSSP
ncbi:unnamed protein product [Vicia faba]|uniref:Uncharacterized protein n=1 Tax=Vicia faba TaxID=3906 RepID=A0AAV0ZFT3_VICFA|nr:unnamed protein product [Vicia faba]